MPQIGEYVTSEQVIASETPQFEEDVTKAGNTNGTRRAATGFIVVESVILAVALYLLVSVTFYFVFRKRVKAPSTSGSGGAAAKRIGHLLTACFICHIMLGIVKFSLTLFSMLKSRMPQDRPKTEIATELLHLPGLFFLYIFLWLRQYSVNQNPIMRTRTTTGLIRLSWITLIIIVVGTAGGMTALSLTIEDTVTTMKHGGDCIQEHSSPHCLIVHVTFLAAVGVQGLLLSLFVRILMHHVHHVSNGGTRTNNVTSDRIRSLVRNCCIAASVTMVTDLIVAIFSSFKRSGHFFGSEVLIFWDGDYVINMICTCFCFEGWRKMLWPWRSVSGEWRSSSLYEQKENSTDVNVIALK